jgi:hypothetical protein
MKKKRFLVNFRWFPSASTFFIAAASACPTFGSKAACLKPQRAWQKVGGTAREFDGLW